MIKFWRSDHLFWYFAYESFHLASNTFQEGIAQLHFLGSQHTAKGGSSTGGVVVLSETGLDNVINDWVEGLVDDVNELGWIIFTVAIFGLEVDALSWDEVSSECVPLMLL